ncbi:Uncharacterised protein [Mycobacterium tuberculosis]|nr:Uncharacterised protein [Mycobacterium tuberculosis]
MSASTEPRSAAASSTIRSMLPSSANSRVRSDSPATSAPTRTGTSAAPAFKKRTISVAWLFSIPTMPTLFIRPPFLSCCPRRPAVAQ